MLLLPPECRNNPKDNADYYDNGYNANGSPGFKNTGNNRTAAKGAHGHK
jgi:hypothetical protein